MAKQTNSLAHTKWMCKYHIVFTPKYRRKIVYNQYKSDLRDILKQLCSYKGVEQSYSHGRYWVSMELSFYPESKQYRGIFTKLVILMEPIGYNACFM